MKHLYLLFAVAFASAQNITFTDPALKAYLLTSSPENNIAHAGASQFIALDANSDGEIQVAEALNVDGLNIDGSFTSLGGIEQFPALLGLSLSNVNIGNLTFPSLPLLADLYLENASIVSLDLSGVPNITKLSVAGGTLTAYALSDTAIENLDFNQMTLDVFSLPQSLVTLNLFDVEAGDIDLHDLPNLTYVGMFQNPEMGQVMVSNCSTLEQIQVDGSAATSLVVQDCASLNVITSMYSNLTNLQISNCPQLGDMNVSGNQLHTLSLDAPSLISLSCAYNQLETLELNAPNLVTFDCAGNLLESLDFSNSSSMPDINASSNHLKNVNIKNGTEDGSFNANFSNNPDLHYICADEQEIAAALEYMQGIGQSCEINTYCNFVPGGDSSSVSGQVRFDGNGDGCDAADAGVPMKFNLVGAGAQSGAYSYAGDFDIALPLGTYEMTPDLENPAFFSITPSSVTLDLAAPGQAIAQYFCVAANGIHHDAEVTMVPLDAAIPGFNTRYYVTYKNNGTVSELGAVAVFYDENLQDFVSSDQAGTNASGSFTFSFTDLQPFESRHFIVTLQNNTPTETPPLNSGDILQVFATVGIVSDEIGSNDSAYVNQQAINSMDPNDKICAEGAVVIPQIAGEYVHYRIRFENTGTAAAHNIVVKDVIDTEKFDVATLVPLAASHDFETRFTGASTVEFIFENIDLPFDDANNDGFVVFKIRTKATLVAGDEFSNAAAIYFDYNFPIVTDPAVTHIQNLGTQDFEFGDYFTLYPNPASQMLRIQSLGDAEIRSIELYDLGGRVVMTQAASQSIDVSALSAGMYLAKLSTTKGSCATKFVKE